MSTHNKNSSAHQQHRTAGQETPKEGGMITQFRGRQNQKEPDSDLAQPRKGNPLTPLKIDPGSNPAENKDPTKSETSSSDKSVLDLAGNEGRTKSERGGSAVDCSEVGNASSGSNSTGATDQIKPEKGSISCSSGNDQTTPGPNPSDNKDKISSGSTHEENKDTASTGSSPSEKKDKTSSGSTAEENKDQASSGSSPSSKGDGAFKEFLKFYREHRIFVMSTFAVGSLSGAVGIFVGAFMYQTLFENKTAQVIVKDDGTNSWEVFQAQLQVTEQKIREEYEAKLRSEIDSFNRTYTEEMTAKTQTFVHTTLQKEIDDAKSDITSAYDAKLQAVGDQSIQTIEKAKCDLEDTFSQKMDAKKTETLEEVESKTASLKEQLHQRLDVEEAVMDFRGYMKFGTYGPFLLIVPLLEILAVWFCCHIFARGNPVVPRRNGAAVQNGDAVRLRPEANRVEPIRTDNRNIALLCFRHDDEDLVNHWGDELLQSCNSTPRKRVHVVESLDDVRSIPPCRAALVFADPDEREMIIEDERHHIGQGLRRQAVQRLLDSGVAVFVIVYHDKNKNDLSSGQMYNRKLGQIGEHAQLKRLKGENRVVSMKNSLKPWQKDHIVGQIDDIFSNR